VCFILCAQREKVDAASVIPLIADLLCAKKSKQISHADLYCTHNGHTTHQHSSASKWLLNQCAGKMRGFLHLAPYIFLRTYGNFEQGLNRGHSIKGASNFVGSEVYRRDFII
jgi:hypothetical protein